MAQQIIEAFRSGEPVRLGPITGAQFKELLEVLKKENSNK